MWQRSRPDSETPRCSFCRKGQASVQKLISSPSDAERAYICDDCVAVCNTILEDDRAKKESTTAPERNELHPLLGDPLTSELLNAVEEWIVKESLGADAAGEFAKVRSIALRLIGRQDQA